MSHGLLLLADASSSTSLSTELKTAVAAFIVGIAVGITGMGGGALMTPALIFLGVGNTSTIVTADLTAAAKAAPEQTNPRISEIKARVQSGYYNSDEVKQQVADALLKSDGMRTAVDDIAQVQVAKQKMDSVPDTRPDAVDQARQRVDEGFYDQPEVRRGTVDKIIDELA